MTIHQQITIADAHFELLIKSPHLQDPLHHIFGSFASPQPNQHPTATFTITQLPNQHIQVISDCHPTQIYDTCDAFLSQFELSLIQLAFDDMAFVGIHAGGVVCNGKTILFPGSSGKGKSTLTLGCVLSGAHLLSDEMALIEPNTNLVYPFPRVLCLKNGIDMFQTHDVENVLQQEHTTRQINNTICLSANAVSCVPHHHGTAIQAIVFPRYSRSRPAKLTAISAQQSLTKLLKLTYKRTETPHVLDTLGKVIETAPAFELVINNLSDAIHEVHNLAH